MSSAKSLRTCQCCLQTLRKAGETAYQLKGSRDRLKAIEELKLEDVQSMAATTREAISRYEAMLQVSSLPSLGL